VKKQLLKLIALLLVAAMLLTGCSGIDLKGYFEKLTAFLTQGVTVSFDAMEYRRPNLTDFQNSVEQCCGQAETETDVEKLMEHVWTCFEHYHDFYTNYALSNIRYCQDMTDIYWEKEYNYCLERTAEVDAEINRLMYALAASPLREALETDEYFGAGYFDAYTGENIWTDEFIALMEQEAALQSRYYDLCAQAMETDTGKYDSQMAQLYVELVALRQEIGTCAGYEDYQSFAYDSYYYRDFSPAQAETYLSRISQQLAPIYKKLSPSVWDAGSTPTTQAQTFSYVKELAKSMGGITQTAFQLMESGGLYDIAPGENKYDASFEVYLSAYGEPFVFMNPTGYGLDQLTFTHEFGHFCNDYASGGSAASVDVAEIFSQGMEYMSLCCTQRGRELETMKLADSLCVYVEQAAYASFEHQVYRLPEEELNEERVCDLFLQTASDFGFDTRGWDGREFVTVTHFYTNPMYVLSYVLSNDAAMQIYQREKEESGAGKALLEAHFATEQVSLLAFLESAGLQSPFAPDRLQSVEQLFKKELG